MGYADANGDGIVTVSEASSYVTRKVRKWAFRNSVQQSPNLDCLVSGDIELTRVPGSFKLVFQDVGIDTKQTCISWIGLRHHESVDLARLKSSEIEPGTELYYLERKAKSIAVEKAKALCALLLQWYEDHEIMYKDGKYVFPDGHIVVSTSEDEEKEGIVYSNLELWIKYDGSKPDKIDKLVRTLSGDTDWASLEYHCTRSLSFSKLVAQCKKSNITVQSFDPAGNTPLVVSAPGWGTAGRPATVYFANFDTGGSYIRIVQSYGDYNRLEDAFFEKLNPKAIAEFINPVLVVHKTST